MVVEQQKKRYTITMSKNSEYINMYSAYAMEQMRRYGIPASVTLAQGIIESASGQSELSRKGNNHFGIKATQNWLSNGGGYLLYNDDKPNEKFCVYGSVADSYEHHSRFLANGKRYAQCFRLSPDDYVGWTNALQKAGYASAKTYAASLQSVIKSNNLQRFDQMVMAEGKKIGYMTNANAPMSSLIHPSGVSSSNSHQNKANSVGAEQQSEPQRKQEKQYFFPLRRDEFLLITSPYGMRRDPMDHSKQQWHKGIDIKTKHDPVLATESNGRVTAVNHDVSTGGGKSVTVEYDRNDGTKVQCTYMHLDSINVKQGDQVKAGQQLGISGNTGTRTTGEHLHFGVKTVDKDGTKKDVNPVEYLAEIALKGNINLQTLHNGKDLLVEYKKNVPLESQEDTIDNRMSPDDWMKKILSSEDSGASISAGGDPIIDMAMTMFTSLMALAVQIDSKSDDEHMDMATDAAVNKRIDLSALIPNLKSAILSVNDNGKTTLHAENSNGKYEHVLTNAELSRISQVLNNSKLSESDKQGRLSNIINAMVLSQQVSQSFDQSYDAQQSQQQTVQRK